MAGLTIQITKLPETKRNSPLQIQRKKSSQPTKSPADRILFLQRTIGNQAVQRLIKSGTLQAKLRIGQPGDVYEQEADRVADEVMRMPEPQTVSGGAPHIQRACPTRDEDELRRQPIEEEEEELQRQPIEEEEEELQAKPVSGHIAEVQPDIESHIHSLKGGGHPLSEKDRAFFEPHLGHDFRQVRMHTDTRAAEAARAVNARAFAMEQDLVFGAGQYAPGTIEGDRLLAHELTHVIQQKRRQPIRNHSSSCLSLNSTGKVPSIQRTCYNRTSELVSTVGCIPMVNDLTDILNPGDGLFLSNRRCDHLIAPEDLSDFALTIGMHELVDIHGFASEEGNAEFNEHLSCRRALRAKSAIEAAGVIPSQIQGVYSHGGTPGERRQRRSIVIHRLGPSPAVTIDIDPSRYGLGSLPSLTLDPELTLLHDISALGIEPRFPMTTDELDSAIQIVLDNLYREIREDDYLRGFFNLPEHSDEEMDGVSPPESVQEGLKAFLEEQLSFLGPLAEYAAEGIVDGLPSLAEAAVDQFATFDNSRLRNALSRAGESLMATILNVRLRREEATEEPIRLPPPRRVEGVGQPFQMRGISIPIRLGRRAYGRQRRRQEFMREEERQREEARRLRERSSE